MIPSLLHFATKSDVANGLISLQQLYGLSYYLIGQYDNPRPLQYQTVEEITWLGQSLTGDFTYANSLLVINDSIRPHLEQVRKGKSFVYELSQVGNPYSVTYTPSAVCMRTIIRGEVANTLEKPSIDIKALFKRHVFSEFSKYGLYLVGNDAERLHTKDQFRLVTMGIDENPIYDFSISRIVQ